MKNQKPTSNKYTKSATDKPTSGRVANGRANTPARAASSRPREQGIDKPIRPVPQNDTYLDELKADLLSFLQINDKKTFSQEEILEHFGVWDRRTIFLMRGLLDELAGEGSISQQSDKTYRADADTNATEGMVDHVNARFAFVIPVSPLGTRGDRDDDIWVSTDDLNGAVDGDRVQVVAFADSRSGSGGGQARRRIEGKVTGILERGRAELVGSIEVSPNYGFVVADSRKIYDDIFIPKEKLGGAKDDEKVIVRITKFPEPGSRKQRFEGEVVTVLGKAGENNTEMHAILAEFGLPIDFPKDVEAEAEAIPTKIAKKDIAKRRDMRQTTTFTIDPVDAKDFDDALSVVVLDNGNYEIGVHIADVTHYVMPGTLLEEEAFKRATSVYLVDRVVPMLPEKLSNGLCSLRPNEDKLTFSAVFELTPDAQIVKEWFGRTITHSDRRFSYEEAQDILNNNRGDFLTELQLLNELAYKLRAERFKNGAINFETNEIRFNLDENGTPLGVYTKLRQDTNKLIEEFMLMANKRVAEFVHTLSKKGQENVMVYRVHEEPDRDRLAKFAEFASKLGFKLKTDEEHLSGSMNKFMHSIEGKPEAGMLSQLAVRTMSKARYSTDDLGHFGLAFERYSHFTSPIRRYPDMMAHRLLQHYLDKGKPVEREPVEQQCQHASAREKMASDAERASIKYKQVEFMSLMDPERTFAGVISGVTEFGIFVEITENSCEGLVRMQDLSDDFYEFDKENYRIIGQRTKKMYTFGDVVEVRVKETNLARRSMDFALVGGNTSRAKTSDFNRSRSVGRTEARSSSRGKSGSGQSKEPAAKGQNRRGGRGKR